MNDDWGSVIGTLNQQPVGNLSEAALAINFDRDAALERLPQTAVERLLALRTRRDDLSATKDAAGDAREDARQEKQRAEQRLKELRTSRKFGGTFELKDNDPGIIAEQRKLDATTARLKCASDHADKLTKAWSALNRVVEGLDAYVVASSTPLRSHRGSAPVLLKNESTKSAIDRIRSKIAGLQADLKATENAPQPSSVTKQRMREQIAKLAEAGRPSIAEDGRIIWSDMRVSANAYLRTGAGTAADGICGLMVPDSPAIMVWLHRDVLVKRLEQQIDAESDDAKALSDAQRAQRQGALLENILALERQECRLITMAESEGVMIDYRAECNPYAVLDLE